MTINEGKKTEKQKKSFTFALDSSSRLFVAYKPPFISSNSFLHRIKKKYRVKKAGFSGTLDPFAKGVLIIAFGSYTKLFRFLDKTPKVYRATLWLGTHSPTLDIENIEKIDQLLPFAEEKIKNVVEELKGEIEYIPPKYSAKKIEGVRSYELARQNAEFSLKPVKSYIYDIKLLRYSHPFLTFEAEVSEGTYIRSIGKMIAEKLGTTGALSMLDRIREGKFVYENEIALDPLKYLKIPKNRCALSDNEVWDGKKIEPDDLEIRDDGYYYIEYKNFFSIIKVEKDKVSYEINRLPKTEKLKQEN
ncbi:tRNA pseudouridine(55) synthase TruB [Nitrosophilus alvini]|uniref:tRNA pseudouridine(55) synthase TruB n=1 Tax=Nitrosophilus alvini TaxID=2714855 RepID=UPI001F4837EE|nr:tRNA pseudouridine(55) synthase TruB [Nitrosophilus alvini]